jgi:CheY-like chemotaxis protein
MQKMDLKPLNFVPGNNPDTDLILMDVKMPKMNGYEATTRKKYDILIEMSLLLCQTADGLISDKDKATKQDVMDIFQSQLKMN